MSSEESDFKNCFDVKSNNIRSRHSTRSFLSDPIPDDILKGILDAGLIAPSSKNRQPWNVVVLRDERVRELSTMMLSKINQTILSTENEELKNDLRMALRTMEIIQNVPILLIVGYLDRNPYRNAKQTDLGVSDRKLMDVVSIGAFIENILLEASERGIGSLWVGDFLYANDVLTDYLHLDYDVISLVALGYPAKENWVRSKRFNDRIDYR